MEELFQDLSWSWLQSLGVHSTHITSSSCQGWGADPAPGQNAGAWLLADISMPGVSSSPVQPQPSWQGGVRS